VPGGWRIEVSPKAARARRRVPERPRDRRPRRADLRIDPIAEGKGLAGAVVAGEAAVLLATGAAPLTEGEATLPDTASAFLLSPASSPRATYDVQLTSAFAPGVPVWRLEAEANDAGVLETPWTGRTAGCASDAGTPPGATDERT
jgi:hypothetical protein